MFQFKIKESNVRLHEFAVLLVSVLQIRHNSEYEAKYSANTGTFSLKGLAASDKVCIFACNLSSSS
jgi:hypothetical protein